MELPDPATLTAEQCTGDVYIRLSEATVAPVLFADPKYSRVLTFNHMVLGNASEVPELAVAVLRWQRALEAAEDVTLLVQNVREELGDMMWYTAGELRTIGRGKPYRYAEHLECPPFENLTTHAELAQAVGYISCDNGHMADVAKRALFYIKPERLVVITDEQFPADLECERMLRIVSNRLRLLSAIAHATGWSLRDVMAANIRKLQGKGGRFAEKFEACRALHRDTKSEMEAHG
jgi:hypothetical protein